MTGSRLSAPLGAGQPIDLRALANRAGGTFNGKDALIPGPGHSKADRSLSLTIGRQGRLIAYSFAADDGAAISALLKSLGVDMSSARVSSEAVRASERERQAKASDTERLAIELWREAVPIAGTPAARYLEGRGIALPHLRALRFHPHCPDGPFKHAALIAARTQLDTPNIVTSIQRTFLRKDGASKADIAIAKKTLGACSGGGVVLGKISGALVVAEGIETALSASAMFAMPAVATLGTTFTHSLIVPEWVRRVVIAADNDKPGLRAAHALAARLRKQGCDVRIETPPDTFKDFNDLANGKERSDKAPRFPRGRDDRLP